MTKRPLVLLDVDGVLNPARRPTMRHRRHDVTLDGRTYRVLLNARHGPKLLALAAGAEADLVWATTWEEHANAEIAPRLGLPPLPVIHVTGDLGTRTGEHFKTRHVAEYVAGRPFVWFDDSLRPPDWQYLMDHPGVGEFLLVEVDPQTGLTDGHLARAREWLTGRALGLDDAGAASPEPAP
ncbi:HAD domain-containing protein [Sphaerisporangium aureirubrum]|uniref:HAD domain-containing protein n=1 Tax=Sphaerisporangium aureirubrum TaxID=1544736 RepID=A0ABW1NI49_9ACTN